MPWANACPSRTMLLWVGFLSLTSKSPQSDWKRYFVYFIYILRCYYFLKSQYIILWKLIQRSLAHGPSPTFLLVNFHFTHTLPSGTIGHLYSRLGEHEGPEEPFVSTESKVLCMKTLKQLTRDVLKMLSSNSNNHPESELPNQISYQIETVTPQPCFLSSTLLVHLLKCVLL